MPCCLQRIAVRGPRRSAWSRSRAARFRHFIRAPRLGKRSAVQCTMISGGGKLENCRAHERQVGELAATTSRRAMTEPNPHKGRETVLSYASLIVLGGAVLFFLHLVTAVLGVVANVMFIVVAIAMFAYLH